MVLERMLSFSKDINEEFINENLELKRKKERKQRMIKVYMINTFLLISFTLTMLTTSFLNKFDSLYTILSTYYGVLILISIFLTQNTDLTFMFIFSLPYLTVTNEAFYYLFSIFIHITILQINNIYTFFLDWQMYYYLRISLIICTLFITNFTKEFLVNYNFSDRLNNVELFPEYSLIMVLYLLNCSAVIMTISCFLGDFEVKYLEKIPYNQKFFFVMFSILYCALNFSVQIIFVVVAVTGEEFFLTTFMASILVSFVLVFKYKNDLYFSESDLYDSDDTPDLMEMIEFFNNTNSRRDYMVYSNMAKVVDYSILKDIMQSSISSEYMLIDFNIWHMWTKIDLLDFTFMILDDWVLVFQMTEIRYFNLVAFYPFDKTLNPINILHFYYMSNIEYIARKLIS